MRATNGPMAPCNLASVTAAFTAPHSVWPKTTRSGVPTWSTPYSIEPISSGAADIAGDANGENITDALIEEHFQRHARIGARQDRRVGMLPVSGGLLAAGRVVVWVDTPAFDKPQIAGVQPLDGLVGSDGRRSIGRPRQVPDR